MGLVDKAKDAAKRAADAAQKGAGEARDKAQELGLKRKQNALAMWGSGPAYGMDANELLSWHKYGGGKELLTKIYASIGANVDESKGSVGAHFLIEPRFLPNLQTTRKTGIEIPPVGADDVDHLAPGRP